MTALTGRPPVSTQPAPHHLVAGALVGAAGVIAFSIAVGSYVVGSSHRLAPSTAAEASVLLAGTPLFVIVGFVHLAVAAGLVAGRGIARTLALLATGAAAIVAAARAAMLLSGIDPTGGPNAGHPTTQGVAIWLIAGAAYGVAALVAARSGRD
jgi:hypothetical protein